MRIHCLLLILVMSSVASCTYAVDDSIETVNDSSAGATTGYYPPQPPAPPESSKHDEWYPNFWHCGTEQIEIQDPKGNKHLIELPIPCDPWADIYRGCPAPENVSKE